MDKIKKYTYEDIKDDINEKHTLLMHDENGELIEYTDIKDYKETDTEEYIKVRNLFSGIPEIYKTLDGVNYDWYPLTLEELEKEQTKSKKTK